MIHLGTVRPGRTVYIPFETFAGSTGAPITLTGLAVGDIKVYKDGSTTERASTSGYILLDTDGIDFDGITGIHGFSIDLSDNTTADFWGAGSRYIVVVSTVTVDSQTMSFIAAVFNIGYDAAALNTTIATLATQTSFTLTTGPAEDDALNGAVAIIHDAASSIQAAYVQVQDYTGSTKTVTLTGGATFTVAAKDNISFLQPMLLPMVQGRQLVVDAAGLADANVVKVGPTGSGTVQTAGDLIAQLVIIDDFVDTEVAAILAAVDTEVAAIKAKTDNLPSDPADASDIAGSFTTVNTKLDTIDDFLDTEIATILTNLGTIDDFLDTEIAAIKAKTDSLAFTSGSVDANVVSIVASTIAASNLKNSAIVIYVGTVTGAATTTTLIDSGLTQADTDHWKGRIVIFLTGTLKYQATDITGFDPATDKLTFTALTQAPAGSDTYVVL